MYFNGTRSCALMLCCFMSLSLAAKDVKTTDAQRLQKPLSFVENKGQVTGQDSKPRSDIQYKLSTPGMSLYVGNGQLHYQFKKTEASATGTPDVSGYQMDVTLLGANPAAQAVSSEEQAYYENYFLPTTGKQAVTVHSFNKVIYKDVYPGIDWVLYVKGNKVEYDFVVRPGGNIHDIQLKYDGATKLSVTTDGSICAETPMGNVKEKSPYSYETATGKAVASNFVLHNNVVSFETAPYSGALTIDPYLEWSTYFGGTLEDVATSVKATSSGETFVGGYTVSNGIGTPGSWRSGYIGGVYDGFLAKYNSAGALVFTTYFGGIGNDRITSIALSNTGGGNPDVFVAGNTTSASLGLPPIAAAHGGSEGFVAAISNNGTNMWWNTFYGGAGADNVNAIVCDATDNVYITGQTGSVASIATGGAYQIALRGINDAYIAKFNGASGSLSWGTYYGGTAQEEGFGIALDATNNVIITGQTNSIINIATPGAHKSILGGTNDAFVAMFSSTGSSLTWGTYFGGTGIEQGNTVICDPVTGAIAVAGNTNSTSGIATTNAHQAAYGGGVQDGFVSYLSAAGAVLWSTYYGGSSLDYIQGLCFDNSRNLVITGGTFSSNGISSPFALQPFKGGDYDAYVVKFNTLGQRIWSTYFGGLYYDYANSVACDNNNRLVIAGYTTSSPTSGLYGSDGIATAGSAQTLYMGGLYDAFVTKFKVDTFVQITQPFIDTIVCRGGTLVVDYESSFSFEGTNTFYVELSDASGSFALSDTIGSALSVPFMTTGSISCTIPPATPTGTRYRIRITTSAPGYTSPDDFLNIEVRNSLVPTTVTASTPSCVGKTLSFTNTAPYEVTAYNWSGPAGSGFGGLGFTASTQNPTNSGFAGTGITLSDSGIYYVVTSHNGCADLTASINVVVNDFVARTPILTTTTTNCVGDAIVFNANPDTVATGITYHWSGPGLLTTMQNPTIAIASLSDAGTYYLYDIIAGCNSPTVTATITVNNNTPVSVSINAFPGDTICKGTNVNFLATPSAGGTTPVYQWMSAPGTPIVGAMSDNFSSSTLIDGSEIYVTMKSSVLCPLPKIASSNVMKMNVISNPPIVRIYSSASNVAPGGSVTFTSAIFNGGTSPLYQWKKNGVAIAGATSDTFVLLNVTRTDTITLELTSTMMCAVPNFGISNAIIAQTNVGVANLIPSLANLELFPNPNSGSFTVKGDYTSLSTNTLAIEILNPIGQVISRTSTVAQNNTINKLIDLKNVADGIYLMRISDGDQSKTLRFTVKH